MGPWGHEHPAEGISAKNSFREAGFGQLQEFQRDKWRIQLFILITARRGQKNKHIFFNFQKKKFPQMH